MDVTAHLTGLACLAYMNIMFLWACFSNEDEKNVFDPQGLCKTSLSRLWELSLLVLNAAKELFTQKKIENHAQAHVSCPI